MANVQKYKASSMGHMFAHYERRKDEHAIPFAFGKGLTSSGTKNTENN